MVSYDISDIDDMLLNAIDQDEKYPLRFSFYFKPGHPKSEELKAWFELHDVNYTVFEQNQLGGIQDACVWFNDKPDMAVMFKLRFG